MENTANIKAVITADDKASSVIKGVGDNTSAAAEKMKTALAAAGAVAITLFGKQSVQAFEESQTQLAQLDAVLKSTGGSAGVTRDAAIGLSKEIEHTTSFSDEAALAVENMGLTFTSIHANVFPQFTKSVLDMATAMNHGLKPGTDQLVDATKQLGKALQDPDGSIGALHRYGINTDELKIKLATLSTVQEKQTAILKEVNTEMGGSATAQAKTYAGQIDQLKEKFNDIQEQVGKFLTTALLPLAKALSEHPALLDAVTVSLLALAAAFVGVKIASGISAALEVARGSIIAVGAAAEFTTAQVASMSAFVGGPVPAAGFAAIAAAAVIAGVAIVNAANQAKFAWDRAGSAAVSAGNSMDDAIRKINASNLSPAEKAQRIRSLSGFAQGGNVSANTPIVVGEQGMEVFVPNQGGKIIPNHDLKQASSGATVNITVQAGALMGSDIEARKFAKTIFDHLKDYAGSKNMTVSDMLGV